MYWLSFLLNSYSCISQRELKKKKFNSSRKCIQLFLWQALWNWTQPLYVLSHGKVKACFYYFLPTYLPSEFQSPHSWHRNFWNDLWPQIAKEKTKSFCKWCAVSSGECWGLRRDLWQGQGPRPGDGRYWSEVKSREELVTVSV